MREKYLAPVDLKLTSQKKDNIESNNILLNMITIVIHLTLVFITVSLSVACVIHVWLWKFFLHQDSSVNFKFDLTRNQVWIVGILLNIPLIIWQKGVTPLNIDLATIRSKMGSSGYIYRRSGHGRWVSETIVRNFARLSENDR